MACSTQAQYKYAHFDCVCLMAFNISSESCTHYATAIDVYVTIIVIMLCCLWHLSLFCFNAHVCVSSKRWRRWREKNNTFNRDTVNGLGRSNRFGNRFFFLLRLLGNGPLLTFSYLKCIYVHKLCCFCNEYRSPIFKVINHYK